jgi:hypothetical protein
MCPSNIMTDIGDTVPLLLSRKSASFFRTVSVFADIVVSRVLGLDVWDEVLTFENLIWICPDNAVLEAHKLKLVTASISTAKLMLFIQCRVVVFSTAAASLDSTNTTQPSSHLVSTLLEERSGLQAPR